MKARKLGMGRILGEGVREGEEVTKGEEFSSTEVAWGSSSRGRDLTRRERRGERGGSIARCGDAVKIANKDKGESASARHAYA